MNRGKVSDWAGQIWIAGNPGHWEGTLVLYRRVTLDEAIGRLSKVDRGARVRLVKIGSPEEMHGRSG